jgi:hypothetical protein
MNGNSLRSNTLAPERAHRRIVDLSAALHVGLREISPLAFAARGRKLAQAGRILRSVRVSDISETGLRIDGSESECSDVAPGDFVALSMTQGGPMMLGTVVRVVPNVGPGAVVIGVRRMPALLSHLVSQAA